MHTSGSSGEECELLGDTEAIKKNTQKWREKHEKEGRFGKEHRGASAAELVAGTGKTKTKKNVGKINVFVVGVWVTWGIQKNQGEKSRLQSVCV